MAAAEARKSILVVEDSQTARAQLVSILRDVYDCREARDGQEALQAALASPPDAVVTDLEMPNLDGVELLRALRADPRTAQIPVIIVTTVTSVARVNECRTLGCAGYVLKPVQKDYLHAKIRQLIRR